MAKLKIKSQLDPSEDDGIDCSIEPSLTVQADAKEADINYIMARYTRTGVLPQMIEREPHFGDFSDIKDYLSSMLIITKAREQFEALDARVRDRFANDPARMLAFVADPANKNELIALGLAVAPVATTPSPASPSSAGQAVPAPVKPPDGAGT